MMTARSRKTLIKQINALKEQIKSLENQIIQTEIIIHGYNKRLAYHDKFKESGFRKVTKQQIRKEVVHLNDAKFQLIENLLEKRQSLSTLREGNLRVA